MEKYEIERLRSLNIEEVAERLGLDISRHKCLCCFHPDKHPSLTFNVRRNTFCCYSCGAHGNVIDLTMQMLKKNFKEACEWLADSSNIIIDTQKKFNNSLILDQKKEFKADFYERFFEHPFLSDEDKRFLFEERHLDPRVVRWCRLNSYKDWLQIPYYSPDGKLIGIQRRYMGHDPAQPRFRFPYGESCHLYNQQVIPMLRPDEPIWIAEGPSDTWAMLSAGHKAVGIPSATLLKSQDLLPLAGRECHVTPDADAAGESLYQKLLATANQIGFCLIRHTLPEGCKDYSDFYRTSVTCNP